jgi:tRNA G10  N-methylase Trm11
MGSGVTSTLLLGDCIDRMRELADNSVDAVVTDPPYGLSFMDATYMRRTFLTSDTFLAGQSKTVTTLADRPDLVTVSYNYLSSGIPQSTTYIKGALSDDIRAWVTKQSASGDKDYVVTVQNLSATDLYINIAAYRVGT